MHIFTLISSSSLGFPNFGRMGYWPLKTPAAAGGAVPAGFEDAEEIEVFHCFFVAYHASGALRHRYNTHDSADIFIVRAHLRGPG
jgi:hypothetical protein